MFVVIHNGEDIPTAGPKDVDSDVWYGFTYPLEDGEVITSSLWLINNSLVGVGDTQDTVTVNQVHQVDNIVRVNISGGTLNRRFILTSRIETTETPKDDRSCYIKVQNL